MHIKKRVIIFGFYVYLISLGVFAANNTLDIKPIAETSSQVTPLLNGQRQGY